MKPTTADEEDIFHQATEIPDAAQREEFLRRVCQADRRLRQSVDAMLEDHERATRLFQEVASGFTLDEGALAPDADAADPDLGTTIGPLPHRAAAGRGRRRHRL